LSELSFHSHEQPTTTSLNVAKVFDKRHDHILRDIEKILTAPNLGASKLIEKMGSNLRPSKNWFFESIYLDKYNREKKCYEMTKDGFMLLAMGFNKKST